MTEEKDLGVIVNNTLSWEKHVISVAAKANKLLGTSEAYLPVAHGRVSQANSIPLPRQVAALLWNQVSKPRLFENQDRASAKESHAMDTKNPRWRTFIQREAREAQPPASGA